MRYAKGNPKRLCGCSNLKRKDAHAATWQRFAYGSRWRRVPVPLSCHHQARSPGSPTTRPSSAGCPPTMCAPVCVCARAHPLPRACVCVCLQVKQFLLPDLLAGMTVGVMAVPQGMSYALVAGMSPKHGLYTSFFPMLLCEARARRQGNADNAGALPLPSPADCIFGTSAHLVSGPTAIVSLLVTRCVVCVPVKSGEGRWAFVSVSACVAVCCTCVRDCVCLCVDAQRSQPPPAVL